MLSLLAQLRIQFSTDSRVQKMFEILLDENSDKEKREKVRTALDLAKWLFDVRGCSREQSPSLPHLPWMEDEGRSGKVNCTQRAEKSPL